MKPLIIGGTSAQVLAHKVARELKLESTKTEFKKFPDGEKYVRILADVEGKEVVFIQSMYKTPDEYLFEYFLVVDTLKDLGAKKVAGVIPYFSYSRQDDRFKPGEAISFKTVAKLIENVGTDEIITIDLHLHRVEVLSRVFKIPSKNITVMPFLARYVKENLNLEDLIVIGPDEEAEKWAKTVAEELKTDFDILEKERISPTEVVIQPKKLNIRGLNVLIIDDIISTGGTIIKTIEVLKKEGAQRIIVVCAHPLLINNALPKIYDAGAEMVIGTDTIPSQVSVVGSAPAITKVC